METEPKKKGRGRPPKAIIDGEATPKKSKVTKRGRPKTDEGEYFITTSFGLGSRTRDVCS